VEKSEIFTINTLLLC